MFRHPSDGAGTFISTEVVDYFLKFLEKEKAREIINYICKLAYQDGPIKLLDYVLEKYPDYDYIAQSKGLLDGNKI